jgi:hypothetical protein
MAEIPRYDILILVEDADQNAIAKGQATHSMVLPAGGAHRL